MVVAEVSIVPLGTGTPSISKYVARALETLRNEKDLKYELTAMGTIIEGDLEKVLEVVKRMHDDTFGEGIVRVLTTIKIDDRRDKPLSIDGKIESVLRQLGH
jgi:uncharacterized protein (TIGR00106 family)